MKYSRSIVSFALVAGLSIGAAFAQDTPSDDSGAPAFQDLAKGKKALGRSDIPSDVPALKELRAHISDYDSDHNGRIDEAEYKAYLAKGSSHTANPSH